MTNRILVAFGTVLIFAAPTFAQLPAQTPAGPPPSTGETPAVPSLTPLEMPGPGQESYPVEGAPSPGPDARFWILGDYVLGWIRGDSLPPLVTTSPAGTAQKEAGVLGQSGTSILFGGKVDDDARSGCRFDTGYWFDHERTLGVEGGFMMLGNQSTGFTDSSNGTTILARPFTNTLTSNPDSVLVAYPGLSSGSVDVKANSGTFYEGHLDFTDNVLNAGWVRLDSMIGYRFFSYNEDLRVGQIVNPTGKDFVSGTLIATTDDFTTHNTFNGGDIGLRTQFMWNAVLSGPADQAGCRQPQPRCDHQWPVK